MITTAKKLVVIIDTNKALGIAIRNDRVKRRFAAWRTRWGSCVARVTPDER